MGSVIYVWNSTKRTFGHASLKLSDGTYISWWPRKEAHSLYTEVSVPREGKPPVRKSLVVNPSKNMKMDTLPALCFFKVKAVLGESYFDDVTNMGTKADHVLMLKKGFLDEERIKHFWMKTYEGQPYILGTNNCADMVFRVLRIGGATAYVPDPGLSCLLRDITGHFHASYHVTGSIAIVASIFYMCEPLTKRCQPESQTRKNIGNQIT